MLTPTQRERWATMDAHQRAVWLTGQLWNATEPLPPSTVAALRRSDRPWLREDDRLITCGRAAKLLRGARWPAAGRAVTANLRPRRALVRRRGGQRLPRAAGAAPAAPVGGGVMNTRPEIPTSFVRSYSQPYPCEEFPFIYPARPSASALKSSRSALRSEPWELTVLSTLG